MQKSSSFDPDAILGPGGGQRALEFFIDSPEMDLPNIAAEMAEAFRIRLADAHRLTVWSLGRVVGAVIAAQAEKHAAGAHLN